MLPAAAPHVTPPLVDDCQAIVPVLPLSDMVPLLVPAQMVVAPDVVPPTDAGDTVMVDVPE